MLIVAIGHSEDVNSLDAAQEVLAQCKKSLKDLSPQAGILYSAIDFEHQVILDEINKTYPDIELTGCTTDGELSSVSGFLEDSISLILFYSDDIQIKVGIGRNISQNLDSAIKTAVEEAKSGIEEDIKFCVTLPESLTVSGVSILESLKEVLGVKIPIFGGLAADQWRTKQTYQFYKNEVLSDSVPILLFAGDLMFSFGVSSGWKPLGKQMTVTKVDKNILYEVNDEPVLDFFKAYLGYHSLTPGEYPLAVFETEGEGFYLRSAIKYDEDIKSITFAGDIPLNSLVQLTQASSTEIIDATKESISQALSTYPGEEPDFALVFSCAARKAMLGINTSQEYDNLKGSASKKFPKHICGFYSYGEIAPLKERQPSRFHNSTFVILLAGSK